MITCTITILLLWINYDYMNIILHVLMHYGTFLLIPI